MAVDRETWARIEAILDQALELPKGDIPALLDEKCAGDPDLRAEVEALLAADSDAGDALELPAGDYAETLAAEAAAEMATEHGSEERVEGREIGPYRVLRHLGGGGMGEVYLAVDTRLGRQVALKLLPKVWSTDHESKERFLREARAAAAFDHPNICTLHDLGETEDGQMYLIMAYYEGETLAQRIARGPLDLAEARNLTLQIAYGLERAHAAGVTHRDVKPANIIVTEGGEAKILDFGIAKIAGDVGLTRTGMSPGTPAYMSPEQTRGEPVDGRTDIWSLGVILWEMIAGQRAFAGKSAMEVYFAVQHRDLEPGGQVREDVSEDLERVISKATAKDLEERYSSVTEMVTDLKHDATLVKAEIAAPRDRRAAAWLTAILVMGLIGLGGWWLRRDSAPASETAPIETAAAAEVQETRPSLAVLFFRNLSGDPELEWMTSGITDLLVTELSQSTDLDILTTSRLYKTLEEIDALEATEISLDLIQEVAERTAVSAVVRGGYAFAGDVLRITFTVEDVASGTSLRTERVQGQGEQSLFSLVDEVGASIRDRFEATKPDAAPRSIQAATTSSLEAWRYYAEGVATHRHSKRQEAVELLEQAVEIDPQFALALAALGRLHGNMGHAEKARDYSRRAFELMDRLPLDQRYWVEAGFYAGKWSTLGRGIDVYERGVAVYPKESWRNNLAARYAYVERYDEAVTLYDALIEEGTKYPGTYISAALAYAGADRFEDGFRVLSDFAARNPESWYLQFGLGLQLTEWGKFEEAEIALDRAAGLSSGEPMVHYAAWRLQVLREDWRRADLEAAKLIGISDSFARWRGSVARARNVLYRGRSREALKWLEDAATAYPEPGAFSALTRCWKAEVHLQRGEPERALVETRLAREHGDEEWPELLGLFFEALALQDLDREADADAARAALKQSWQRFPNTVEERQLDHLAGRLALARGEIETATEALRRAEAQLPPRGVWWFHWHLYPDQIPIWRALGEAHLAAGRPGEAEPWLERVTASGAEHLEQPVPYVRSFHALGRIQLERGETAAARRSFERFLALWQAGDLDPQKVAEAQQALGAD